MISDPDPQVTDLEVLAPSQLVPGHGIVNVGTVATRPVRNGVFVLVDATVLRISLATGKIVENTETLIFHESDEVWVVESPVHGCSCGEADYGTPGHDGSREGHGA